jgi:hypothetical protein
MEIRRLISWRAVAVAAASILMIPATVVAGPKFTIAEIPSAAAPDCDTSFQYNVYARRMNDQGQAVGHTWCYVATGNTTAPFLARGYPFAWSAPTGSFALVIPPGETGSVLARDINGSGAIVGWRSDVPYGVLTWTFAGGFAELSDEASCRIPLGFPLLLRESGINDAGSIAYTTYRYNAQGYCARTLVLRRATGEEVTGPVYMSGNALNNSEVAVGTAGSAAVKWSPALGTVVLSPYEDLKFKTAWNLNQRGDVVGYVEVYTPDYLSVVVRNAMLWPRNGGEVSLPKLRGYPSSFAYDINNDQSIVGFSEPVAGAADDLARATLWISGQVWDLNDLIPRNTGIRLIRASSINRAGQIVATGVRPNEAKKPCPRWDYDPQTGEPIYNATYTCQDEYSFILTPKDK